MKDFPYIDFGHTPIEAAFGLADVYGVQGTAGRAAKQPLSIAIVGCGGVAQAKWIPAIRRLQTIGEPLAIAGVVDPDEGRRQKAASLSAAPGFATLAELFAQIRPDLVLVLTPDAFHLPLAEEAIELGVPCLVEKPLARIYREASSLARFAEERGVLLAAVANKRFSPPYAQAKALIQAGALKTEPTVFTGKFTLGYPYVDLLEGGTVHLLDLLLWFMGPVARLNARGTFVADRRMESAVVSFGFASGAIGTIMTSAAGLSFAPWERVEIFGRNAFLVVDDQLELTLHEGENAPARNWRPSVPNTLMFDESFGGYTGLLENVVDAVRGLARLESSGRDGAAAIALIDAIRLSLERDAEIDLSIEGLTP